MAARTPRINTPTEQNKANTELLVYRLEKVEEAVNGFQVTIASLNSPTKQDLYDFRDALLKRFDEKNAAMQKDIDSKVDSKENNTAHEAIWTRLKEIVGLIKWIAGAFGTALIAVVVYYATSGRN